LLDYGQPNQITSWRVRSSGH